MADKSGVLAYPSVTRNPDLTIFEHGAEVPDHYRWLEDLASQEVREFEAAQKDVTTRYLKQYPESDNIKTVLNAMNRHKISSCPTETSDGHYYFFMKNPEESMDSLFGQKGIKGKPELVISPHDLPGTQNVLHMFCPSLNGDIVAYAYGKHNSIWSNIRFKGVKTSKEYPETLMNVCYSDISWTHDHKGIMYSCYLDKKEMKNHRILFHRIGTNQRDDVILVEFPHNPTMIMQAQISTDSGDMVFISALDSETSNRAYLFYGDLKPVIEDKYESVPPVFQLLEGDGLEIQYITSHEGAAYFRTNRRAKNFRIVKATLMNNKLLKNFWETIVPEDKERLLDWAVCVNKNNLMLCYIEEMMSKLELYDLTDGVLLYKYSLPIGTIIECSGGRNCTYFFFTFTSFVVPDCVRYIEVARKFSLAFPFLGKRFKKIKYFNNDLRKAFPLSGYSIKQRKCVNGKDGIEIPLFLIHKKKIKRDGHSPCIIYGQGCFGNQIMPSFCIPKFVFLHYFNGIIAVVGVRGGGEYGKTWYLDGTGVKKQNTYDDFVAATEYLIKLGYTSPSKLILEGQQFGGNLAAACLVQRPDLYGAVIIHDGLLDLIRYHFFKQSESFEQEFGNPENISCYQKILKISPLHNILNENTALGMPAVMVLLGNEATLAHPSNSFKFIAELQYSLASKSTLQSPFLLRVSDQINDETTAKIEERADIFAFLAIALGLKFTEISGKK